MHRTTPVVSRTARAAIRRVHRSLCSRLSGSRLETDACFCAGFSGIVAAVEAGLRQEEIVLERMGHGGLRVCIEDNAVLLRALHRVLPAVEAGDAALGRDVVGAVHDVLALRRLACDVALAALASPVHAGSPRMRMRTRRLPTPETQRLRAQHLP